MHFNQSKWQPHQVDILFLLVGTNPLPNYVASCLLAKPDATIVLLSTKDTHPIAKQLRRTLQDKNRSWDIPEPHEIDTANAQKIYQEVEKLVKTYYPNDGKTFIGLNYTGGTKAMAVHAYRAVENATQQAVFSYLDARNLTMRIDAPNKPSTQVVAVERDCTIQLDKLVELHGYRRPKGLRKEPRALKLARAILDVYLKGAQQDWQRWIESGLQSLPTAKEYPSLQPAIDVFAKIGNEKDVARYIGFSKLSSCTKWLNGEWLEELVAESLKEIAEFNEVDDHAVDIKLKQKGSGREMQIDAAAIRGYQLFAFSCIATSKKAKAKEHLLEIFVRAQQIGGEEARMALVCFYNDPLRLEQEIQEDWLAQGKIKVFGPRQLPNLSDHIRQWLQSTP